MNIIICDDMPKEAAKLKALLNAAGHIPTIFNHGADVLKYIENGGPADVCILDIVMPEMSGVELSRRLRQLGWGGRIVFLSSSREFGPESYEVKAFDYLIKPPIPERVRAMLQKLTDAEKNADTKSIILKTRGTVRSVLFRDISHLEAMQHIVIYHLTDGSTVEVYTTFADAAGEILKDSRFLRCHRSFIVNMDEIASITGSEVTMRGNKTFIPISRAYGDAKRQYFDHGLTKQTEQSIHVTKGGKQP